MPLIVKADCSKDKHKTCCEKECLPTKIFKRKFKTGSELQDTLDLFVVPGLDCTDTREVAAILHARSTLSFPINMKMEV